jgi:hypothetical protein
LAALAGRTPLAVAGAKALVVDIDASTAEEVQGQHVRPEAHKPS